MPALRRLFPGFNKYVLHRLLLLTLSLATLWTLGASKSNAMKPERILYIRVQFADKTIGGGPDSKDISEDLWLKRLRTIDKTAEQFWVFNSYGKITEFQSQFTQILTLPAALTPDSPYESGAKIQLYFNDALTAATEAGWDLSQFDRTILSFPGLPKFPAGALGGGSRVWMPGSNPFDGGFIHEFGHAIGVGHASAFEGGDKTYPGEHREGRDGLFMMGSEGGVAPAPQRPRRGPVNLPMRYKLGFVDEPLIKRITVDQGDVYRIYAFDRRDVSKDVAKGRTLGVIFKHDKREWWVSYAPSLVQRWGVDFEGRNHGGGVWQDGIMVHELTGEITRILDFTPGSQGEGNEEDYVDIRDGALRVGQSFTFPDSKLMLAPLKTGKSRDGTAWIDVRISF